MSPSPADRNLVFGVLALQMNFVGRDDLIAAMHAWALDQGTPLGRILCDRGHLTAAQLAALDALLELNLQANGGDPQRSLHSLSAPVAVASLLAEVTRAGGGATLSQFRAADGSGT